MKPIKFHKYIILMLLICHSCTQKHFNTEKELWTYLKKEDHGYTQHKRINGIDYTLMYRPTDLLIKQEIGEDVSKENISRLRKKYEKHMYFNLSMSRNNHELLSSLAGKRSQFGAMVYQLAFDMKNKVHLYNSKRDTIPMVDYSYPRMYGMSGNTSILFAYPRDQNNLEETQLHFIIRDLGFQTGEVQFKISTHLLKNEPRLRF